MAAAVVAMAATRGTLAIRGALVSQLITGIRSLTLVTRRPQYDPNPPDDPWDAYTAAPEPLRAMIGCTRNSKEAEKITLPTLPKAHMFRHWKLIVRKFGLSASVDPHATWLWLLEIEKEGATFDTLYNPGD